MSSYLAPNTQLFTQDLISQQHHIPNPEDCFSTSQSSFTINSEYPPLYDTDYIITQALAILQQPSAHCMNDQQQFYTPQPNIRIETSTPTPLPLTCDGRQDSVISGTVPTYENWQMYQTSMGGPAISTHRPFKRARSHQRTPSASTVASTGPASPYTVNTSYPYIANSEFDPNSPGQAHFADQALFSKNLPTPQQTPTDSTFYNAGYIPSQVAHTPNAHLAMKGFAIDHHIADDFPPEFIQSSRHSMSSRGGNDSPATPQSGVGENYDPRNYMPQNDFRQSNPNVQLFRTESQAYEEQLYNPGAYTSTPLSATKQNHQFLTPHRSLVSERLQTANLARSSSPTSAMSRERSPFRDGSPLAPASDWKSTAHAVNTAASMRQQQKEEAEQAEYAQHRPQLQREPTKTISPKDALLDYADADQPSLFQDNVPAGYRQHTGGTETWSSNFVSTPGSTFGNLVANGPSQQHMTTFRNPPADEYTGANFNYMQLPPTHQDQASQIQHTSVQPPSYPGTTMTYSETNPEFPANLTSMESSISEGGLPPSSQESFHPTSMPQRPSDTRASTGTYTCTYHGCTHRFETHNNLQKHKRDFHRSQQLKETSSTETDTGTTTSARSTESPAPSSNGMTSAALLERNSQAGPHKCTRINPSTNKPCNTVFSRPYDLTRHEDTIHNNRKQKVRCPMCREEKTFSRNDALTRHMRVVHPEVEAFGKRSRRD